MSSHAEELEGLFDAREEEEEIEFENEGVETSPTSTNSDGFTEVKSIVVWRRTIQMPPNDDEFGHGPTTLCQT